MRGKGGQKTTQLYFASADNGVVMRYVFKIALFLLLLVIASCSEGGLFSGYRKEAFPTTRVTGSNTKTIQILNESETDVQHILSIAFYANSNENGHFQVSEVRVGTEKVGQKDVFIPPMGVLNLDLAYAPLNLETTEATYGGWTTTSEDRGEKVKIEDVAEDVAEVKGAVSMMAGLIRSKDSKDNEDDTSAEDDEGSTEGVEGGASEEDEDSAAENTTDEEQETNDEPRTTIDEYEPAIHRAMLIVAYDNPQAGYVHVELVGGAVPGPNGEVTAIPMGGAGEGECVAQGTTACFTGTFSIDLPGLMTGGAVEVPMNGPVPFTVENGAAELNMDEFPPVLLALKGNGPGEPLEGKPVDAVSIVISGTPECIATGSFDGRNLSLAGVGFRIRVLLGEITYDDINPGLVSAVDFNIEDLEIITDEPFDGSKIIFGVEATLSENPSGNGLFDAFLGGVRVVVKFTGMLELP